MRQFFIVCAFAVIMFTSSYPAYTQQLVPAVKEPDITEFILIRLDALSKKFKPMYEKALGGDIADRKQLLEIAGETNATMELISVFNDYFTPEQQNGIRISQQRFPQISSEEDDQLTAGLALEMADESIALLDQMVDLVIMQTQQVLAGDMRDKELFMLSVFDLLKQLNIIDLFELTDKQRNKMDMISHKMNNASYNGQQISLELIFGLLKKTDIQLNNNTATVHDREEVDKLLDRYEALMNESFPILRKMISGDLVAEQEYNVWAEKQQSLSEELSVFAGVFTPEQTQRMQDIVGKFATEASLYNADKADDEVDTTGNYSECSLILDEFEAAMEQYLVLYPKVVKGEQQAVEEMEQLAEKLQVIGESISGCSSNFTKEDLEKIQRISDKVVKVLSSEE